MTNIERDERIKNIVKIKDQRVDFEVDWEGFRKLEAFREETYSEQLYVAAVKQLREVGVLSIEEENKYGLLVDGSYGGPYINGARLHFNKKEDAEDYAKVKWNRLLPQGRVSIIFISEKVK